MRTIPLGTSGMPVPVVGVGCMRITSLSEREAERFIQASLELGANFFDHADIYGRGESEIAFARAARLTADAREKVILQSKCGIVPGTMYDFSKAHILGAVDGILQRLGTEYLDVLLLHRPDPLCEPEEVAEAFDLLYNSGKVRHFGVSNHKPVQIRLLQKHVHQALVANQLQLSIAHASMITQGMHVNMAEDAATDRDGDVLDYCRLKDITIQPWSPFQYGFFEGVFIGSERYAALNAKLEEIGEEYGASPTTIAMAWLLRHPANFQPIVGTTSEGRLRECVKATDIRLTRKQWYEILLSAGNTLP